MLSPVVKAVFRKDITSIKGGEELSNLHFFHQKVLLGPLEQGHKFSDLSENPVVVASDRILVFLDNVEKGCTQTHMQMQQRQKGQQKKRRSGFSFFNLLYCSSKDFDEMLGSSDSHEDEEEEKQENAPKIDVNMDTATGSLLPGLSRLLTDAAEALAGQNWNRAGTLISDLQTQTSTTGDATERLGYFLTRALSARLTGTHPDREFTTHQLQNSYLSFNQVTPFLRFSHLTANQAILESLENEHTIHIVDLNIMQGVQWPPFMQALAERPGGPPALIRITGTGPDPDALHRTGNRLRRFAQTLGLHFQFNPLPARSLDQVEISSLPGEALAVNCVLHLHNLLNDNTNIDENADTRLRTFLVRVRSLDPRVVTLAERECDQTQPGFVDQFAETLSHYSCLFDSLEATLPPNSSERLMVEKFCLGREIMNIISGHERYQRFERWSQVMNECGFTNVALSEFSVSQARLLLRLHYPSEGYHLQPLNNSLFLGWQHSLLFSVSSWH